MAGRAVHCQEGPAEVRGRWLKACLPSASQAMLPGAGLPHPDKALVSDSHKGNMSVSTAVLGGRVGDQSYCLRLGLYAIGF